jgi:hypothetical protein
MADINFETQRLAELMAEVNRQMQEYGTVTKDTQQKVFDANMKLKYGVNNATQSLSKAGEAAGHMAKAAMEAGKAMYDNKKGASAFNSSLDAAGDAASKAGTALMMLGGPIGFIVGGLLKLTGGVVKLAKVVNEQSDALYKGFQDLSKSGGAASDGMTGLFGDIQKLGLGFQDLEGYTRLIADSSKELALFGGSVIQGRKQFANIGEAMAPFRESLFNAGMTQEEINEASMGYLRLQSRIGQTQNKTTQELADSARKYLIEQDALTKLTGMTRKEQEDAREEIRSQERFAATLAEMRAKGQHAAAKELEDTYLVLRSQSKEAAQGFADVSTGMLTTEAAQKSYLATQGQSMRVSQQIQAGQLSAAQGAQRLAKAHGDTAEAMAPLAKMGIYGQTFGDYAADLRLKGMAEADIEKQLAKVRQEQIDQGVTGKSASDKAQDSQTKLRLSQQQSMLALQKLVNHGVEPLTGVMEGLAQAVERVTMGLTKIANFFGLDKGPTAEEKKAQADVDARQREVLDLEWKVVNAKNDYDKKIAKQELEAAKSRLLSAEVERKYVQDRVSGKTGAGIGGQELRADGSMIQPGDEDYVSPEARAQAAAGQTAQGATADSLGRLGLKIKQGGDVQAAGEKVSPKLVDLAKQIQNAVPGFKYFSGFNDQYHKGTTSKHAEGMALDFVVNEPPDVEQGKKIVAALQGLGASKVIDEYNFPSSRATAGHFHVEVPKFAEGGIAQGPKSGYPVELHGTEAVIPLKNGTVPVSLDLTNSRMFRNMQTQKNLNLNETVGKTPKNQDLDSLKTIAVKLGANDEATKKITNPDTWKDILNSGVSMNYNMGIAEITSKMVPSLGKEIGERIQELKTANNSDSDATVARMATEFKTAMLEVVKNINTGNNNSASIGEQLSLLSQLVREQQNSNDIQKKLLQAASN